ncbi:MAG: phytanoyl-CoA dioxygenase family protein [Pseudomonadota bacterium]
MKLSAEQIQSYHDDGYILLERVIDQSTLDRMRATISQFLEASRDVSESDPIYDLDKSHTPNQPRVRRLKDPHLRDPVFSDLAKSDAILDPVAQLLGGTVRFDHSKLNFKHPGAAAEIQWHQDWAFYPYTNDDLLAVGVMIEDCTAENGPLLVIPGSHKGPVYDHHQNDVFAGGVPEKSVSHLLDSAVDVTGPAGSISIHHVRTLHASRNNLGQTLRPLLLFSYAAVDSFPIFESYDLDEFDSRILRGEPVREGRMEAVPFRLHLPRRQGNDSIYDDQESMAKQKQTSVS